MATNDMEQWIKYIRAEIAKERKLRPGEKDLVWASTVLQMGEKEFIQIIQNDDQMDDNQSFAMFTLIRLISLTKLGALAAEHRKSPEAAALFLDDLLDRLPGPPVTGVLVKAKRGGNTLGGKGWTTRTLDVGGRLSYSAKHTITHNTWTKGDPWGRDDIKGQDKKSLHDFLKALGLDLDTYDINSDLDHAMENPLRLGTPLPVFGFVEFIEELASNFAYDRVWNLEKEGPAAMRKRLISLLQDDKPMTVGRFIELVSPGALE
jgi:hypothetical protein